MIATPAAIAPAFEAAWNAHDMVAFGDLFWPDATFVNRFATFSDGVDAIVAIHRAVHDTVYRDSVLTMKAPDVRLQSPDVAVVYLPNRLSVGAAHPRGPHLVDTLILAVVVRRDQEWRIAAAENVTLIDPRTGKEVLRPDDD